MKIKILFIGDLWHGSNAKSLAIGLAEAGNDVISVDTTALSAPKRFSPEWNYKRATRERAPWVTAKVMSEIRQKVELHSPDLLFCFKTIFLPQAELIDLDVKTKIHYSADDTGNPYNVNEDYILFEKYWDLIVTTKKHNIQETLDRGAQAVKFVLSAYDPTIHYRSFVELSRRYSLGFIGNLRPDRLELVTSLKEQLGEEFFLAGDGWNRNLKYLLKGAPSAGPLYGDRFSKAVGSIDVNLVLLNSENRDTHTCRSFEVPAAGGLVLAEDTDEHHEILEPNVEAFYFGKHDNLLELAREINSNERLKSQVREAGHKRICKGRNTYADRAKDILAAIW